MPQDDSRQQVTDLLYHVQGHVQSLKAAGVEWLPRGVPWAPAAHVQEPARVKAAPALESSASTPPVDDTVSTEAASGLNLEHVEQRRQALHVLAEEVKTCTRCPELASTRTQTVFAHGEPGVELCFIGEAPGADEDAQGLPFVGAAGQLLNKIINACGMKREDVYICNILKCRPPGNRTPLPNEAACCRGFLERQLELVQPRFIVALGSCAAQNLLNTTTPLGKMRGRFHDYKGIPVVVTYHPAYLLPHRNPDKKKDVWEDMKMLLTRMGKPIPQK